MDCPQPDQWVGQDPHCGQSWWVSPFDTAALLGLGWGGGLREPSQPSRVCLSPLPFPTAKVEQVKFDATTLHAKPQMAAQQKMVDDGSGEVEVGLCLGFTLGCRGIQELQGRGVSQPWQQHVPFPIPPGLACGKGGAGACGEEVAGPFLWGGLLPGALHLLCGAQGEPHHLHLAGEITQIAEPWVGDRAPPWTEGALPLHMTPSVGMA